MSLLVLDRGPTMSSQRSLFFGIVHPFIPGALFWPRSCQENPQRIFSKVSQSNQKKTKPCWNLYKPVFFDILVIPYVAAVDRLTVLVYATSMYPDTLGTHLIWNRIWECIIWIRHFCSTNWRVWIFCGGCIYLFYTFLTSSVGFSQRFSALGLFFFFPLRSTLQALTIIHFFSNPCSKWWTWFCSVFPV